MATCNPQNIVLFVHGELPWYARLSVRIHLAQCASCRAEVQRHAMVASMIRGNAPASVAEATPARTSFNPGGLARMAVLALFGTLVLLGAAEAIAWAVQHSSPPKEHRAAPKGAFVRAQTSAKKCKNRMGKLQKKPTQELHQSTSPAKGDE